VLRLPSGRIEDALERAPTGAPALHSRDDVTVSRTSDSHAQYTSSG